MRIPVAWLNEYAPNKLTIKKLAWVLTNVGLEVEAVEDAAGAAIFDIKVTPNRGDCLSVLGLARELSMALRSQLKTPQALVVEYGPPAESLASVVLEDPAICPRYSARIVRGVAIAPSPAWAQRRLELCGLRPINNIVDATNLVLLELGQPLHAFDYRLLRSPEGTDRPQIIVRRGRAGERLITIDGEERKLTPEILVIADPGGPIALAGIMGGSSSEINDNTTDVLLESAHFDAGIIRRGARSLGMSTEASFRFERTVDPGGTVRALDRACELITQFCPSAEVARGLIDAYPNPVQEAEISLRPKRVNALLGLRLSKDKIAALLRLLYLEVEGSDPLKVRIPTFRQDLNQEIDLIEEVARAHGYDKIPEHLPRGSASFGRLPAEMVFERQVRQLMRGLGLSEAVTSSLESAEVVTRLGLESTQVVALSNAKTMDRSQLRITLLTSMLDVVAQNHRHGISDVSIFDLGRVYLNRNASELPDQPQHLGIAVSGVAWRDRWAHSGNAQTWDFYSLKGVVDGLLEGLSLSGLTEFVPDSEHPTLQAGSAAQVNIKGENIGYLGEVSEKVRDAYDISIPVYVAEFDLDLLRKLAVSERLYVPVSRFPAVTRDVAFILPRNIAAKRAETVIRESAGDNLEELSLFDAYEGKPLALGERNLAFSLTFRRTDRTLTFEEVDTVMAEIKARLREKLEARIRE